MDQVSGTAHAREHGHTVNQSSWLEGAILHIQFRRNSFIMTRPCRAIAPHSRIPSPSLLLQAFFTFFVLLADAASPKRTAACDFTLPPLSFHTSLSHSVNYPPLAVAPAASRYSWACQASKGLSNTSVFKVDAHVNLELSGMLLVAAENSIDLAAVGQVLNVEVVMADPLGTSPDAEWNIKSEAMLSYSSSTHGNSIQSEQPTLWLHFVTPSCGCVRRLRFIWTRNGSTQEESCEVPATSQETGEHGACAPFWAYSKSTCKQQASHLLPSLVDLPSSTACRPVLWHNIPPPKSALAVSFNGNCKYDFMVCGGFIAVLLFYLRSFEVPVNHAHRCQNG